MDAGITRRPITIEDLAALRAAAAAAARTAGVDPDRAQQFALAVSEAATNTILHAGGSGEITVGVDGDDTLYARVVDHGPGLSSHSPESPPEPKDVGGRGLWLIRQLVDVVDIDHGPGGTVVHMSMTIAEPAPDTDRSR